MSALRIATITTTWTTSLRSRTHGLADLGDRRCTERTEALTPFPGNISSYRNERMCCCQAAAAVRGRGLERIRITAMRPPTISLDTSQWHALSEAAKDEPRNPHDLKLLVQLRELADRQEIMLPSPDSTISSWPRASSA